MVGLPPLANGEFIALPFAVGCGFAGGGLRELCPKEAIWHFSPFVFTEPATAASGRWCGRCEIDWQVVLLLAPVALELLRQALGVRWSDHQRLFYLAPTPPSVWTHARRPARDGARASPRRSRSGTTRASSTGCRSRRSCCSPRKIEALANQINPHFLFNTLTSISSLIRTQPETARMLITKLSGLLRRLMRSTDHFVTLREELESIDEYLDIEVVRFGPQLQVEKQIGAGHARRHRAEHDPAAARRELDQARPRAQGRRRPDHDHARALRDGHTIIEVHDDGLGMTEERLRARARRRHRPEQRQRAAARRSTAPAYQLQLTSVPGQGTCGAASRFPSSPCRRTGHGVTMRLLRAVLVDDEQLARDELGYLLGAGRRRRGRRAGRATASRRCAPSSDCSPTSSFSTSRCRGSPASRSRGACSRRTTAAHIVFVTAFDQHAIEAFEVNAVDYLLKPVDPARLELAVERARRRVASAAGRGDADGRTSARDRARDRSSSWSPSGRAAASSWPSRSASGSCSCRPTKSSTRRWPTKRSPS